jgi:hypothetical protein
MWFGRKTLQIMVNNIDPARKTTADTGQEIVKPPPSAPPAAMTPSVTIGQPTEAAAMTVQPRPNLSAAVLAERNRGRARNRLKRSLGRLVRGDRIPWRAAMDALGAEDQHVGAARDPARKTHAEALVQALGKRAADRSLARSQRGLNRRTRKTERMMAKQARLRVGADHRAGDRLPDPLGGHDTTATLQQDGVLLRNRIRAEMADGSLKHGRFPRWIRHIPKFVLVADFSMLLYFFAGITNVDWASPVSASLVFAALLAAMVTVLSYGFLAFAGYRLRTFKDHSGGIARHALDGLTKAACGAAAGGAAVIAALMFVRMRAEVLDALGPAGWVTAVLIAVVLAVVSALANFLVVLIHALDGSDEVARLDMIGSRTRRPLGKAHRMREKAAAMTSRVAVQQRLADRHATSALTKAGRHLTRTDHYLQAARSLHQGAGPHAGPAIDPGQHDGVVGYLDDGTRPTPDLRPLQQALDHAHSPLPGTATSGPARTPAEAGEEDS